MRPSEAEKRIRIERETDEAHSKNIISTQRLGEGVLENNCEMADHVYLRER